MLRHEFQPGKLVGGLFVTAAGVIYLGDAAGAWQTPWFVVLPLTFGGLCLAGAVAFIHHAIRGHRASCRTGGEDRRERRGGRGRQDQPSHRA
ncbi:hypothetical protein SMA5143A_5793 [Streptomyces sp. MA5143a]|nr:hypothetical protein SMA5143A_5793 [Streptomyces sp. MA5143a]